MTNRGSSSHVGSVLSCADILAVCYQNILHVDPTHPKSPNRDRFLMSKGHAGAGLYAALAEKGFFPKEYLEKHGQDGSRMSGHVSHVGLPGVEFSTGSLGHGLSVGIGMALARRFSGLDYRVFVLVSDGELDEGSIWEGALFAAHHRLAHLVVVVDANNLQSLDTVENTLGLEPLDKKWQAFGWDCEVVDGHNHEQLTGVLQRKQDFEVSRPKCIIARTVKGKGVSFMENKVVWHYRPPKGEDFEKAIAELRYQTELQSAAEHDDNRMESLHSKKSEDRKK